MMATPDGGPSQGTQLKLEEFESMSDNFQMFLPTL
jgi:hypothetical protein